MRQGRTGRLVTGVFVLWCAQWAAAQTHRYWVPAVAHAGGAVDSEWRSDVGVLNLCVTTATVQLRLHTATGVLDETYEIAPSSQQLFTDVVAGLTTGEVVGSLEIISDRELIVTSRTYNQTGNGSFGQSLNGITPGKGLDLNETAYLQQLRQDSAFRTNLGLLNMGSAAARVVVSLYDHASSRVGAYTLDLPAGQLKQDNAPFSNRYRRSDIVAGFARVEVTAGEGVYAYASLVDNQTGDPTTMTMKRWDGECSTDAQLDSFFSTERVHRLAIEVGDSGVASLLVEPRRYVHAAVSVDGLRYADVGVRLKGAAGSFIPLDGEHPSWGRSNGKPGKSAFIIDFNRYVAGSDHLSLEKLTVNNLVQDPSGIHEYLGYTLFRWGDVPASRSGWATVSFNGEDKGLYALIETPDNDEFLQHWFSDDDGNLYEGAYGADLRPELLARFDQDNGDDESRSDLAALAATLEAITPQDDPFTVLDTHLELDRYLTFAATELYLGHWDGYTWSSNNYLIHHDLDSNRWSFLPWGIDQLFEDELWPYAGVMRAPGPSWSNEAGRVHTLCFASATCRSRLAQAFADLLERTEDLDLAAVAEEARTLVEPLLLAEATAYGDPQVTRQALTRVSDFIAGRSEQIRSWLPCLRGTAVDNDGDSHDGCTSDCADWDRQVHPGATETCNLRDDDCNDVIDDPAACPRCLDEIGPDGARYGLCFDHLGWSEARGRCQVQGRDLASLHDLATFEHLSRVMLERLGQWESWIGLNDRDSEGTFAWSDGTPVDFTAWLSGAPNPRGQEEDCVRMIPFGWFDCTCDRQRAFICKGAPGNGERVEAIAGAPDLPDQAKAVSRAAANSQDQREGPSRLPSATRAWAGQRRQ